MPEDKPPPGLFVCVLTTFPVFFYALGLVFLKQKAFRYRGGLELELGGWR